eukprot:scaffold49615_cov59-Cyclotella_meneghiniana.AAC.2
MLELLVSLLDCVSLDANPVFLQRLGLLDGVVYECGEFAQDPHPAVDHVIGQLGPFNLCTVLGCPFLAIFVSDGVLARLDPANQDWPLLGRFNGVWVVVTVECNDQLEVC